MTREDPSPAQRCFVLDPRADEAAPRMIEEDRVHALRVLRLGVGDEFIGLDGRGLRWPLAIAAIVKERLELRPVGPALREPEPGAADSRVAWIEVAAALPRGPRADEMLERLVQLGVASIVLVISERSQGFAREQIARRSERWERVVRSACKQAQRTWFPELAGPWAVGELLGARPAAATILLSPRATAKLADVVARAAHGTRALPLRLLVGPEGGWTAAEEQQLSSAGALPAALGPHVLRVETAAEAAAAIALQATWSPS